MAPSIRGGDRNAGTLSPTDRATSPKVRAVAANASTPPTHRSIAPGYDSYRPCIFAATGDHAPLRPSRHRDRRHLGTRRLAGLAVAGIVLTAAFAVFDFLTYFTTSALARRLGAGRDREATETGLDTYWLALGLGVALMVLGLLAAPLVVDAMGASARVRPFALTFLRISSIGAPAYLIPLAGAGFLRGMKTPRPRSGSRWAPTS